MKGSAFTAPPLPPTLLWTRHTVPTITAALLVRLIHRAAPLALMGCAALLA